MVHVDTKRLPLLKGQKSTDAREYLFVGIDDFSRELYAAIMPDKTALMNCRLSTAWPPRLPLRPGRWFSIRCH